jgi:hypothetical protein
LKDRWNRLKDKLGIKKTDAKTDKPTGKLEQPKVKPEEPTVDTTKGTDPTAEVATRHGGGRAGIGEWGWRQKEEYSSLSQKELQEKVEELRHQLLQRKDIGRVKNALVDFGIPADDQLIAAVKRYNFDSKGIGFMADNYDCWNRLARGEGTIRDAQYLVHEMTEVRELQRIQQQTGFDFMGTNYEQMTKQQRRAWNADFERYYMQSHRKALESEYDFLAEQVSAATNGRVEIPRNVVASVDPTRGEARSYMLVDGAPLQDHPNFNSWQQRGQETVEIGKGARERLRIRNENPTLAELVQAVKQRKLK